MILRIFSALVALAAMLIAQAAATDSASLASLREYASGGDVTALRNYEQLVAKAADDPAIRELVEADLARVLAGTSTFEAKRFACTQLAVIGTQASIPPTAALLRNDETVGIACLALATNPSGAASQVLRNALGRLKGQALVQVINTLGTRRDTTATPRLRQLAEDPDPAVAGAAYLALGKIATAGALSALADARKKHDLATAPSVAAGSFIAADRLLAGNRLPAAVRIYEELLEPARAKPVRRGAFEALVQLDRDGGLARVMEAVTGTDAVLKASALAAVATLPNPAASTRFGDVLPRLAPSDQAMMVESLARRNDAEARQLVQDQLESPYELVRTVAIESLGRIGDSSSVPALARAAFTARTESQLRTVEQALAGLPGGDAVDQALAAQLRNRMAGTKVPFLAALVRRANPVSRPVFVAETASPDPAMAKLGFQGLGRVIGPADVPVLLDALARLKTEDVRPDATAAVAQALSRVGIPGDNAGHLRAALDAAPGPTGMATFLPLLVVCPDAPGLARAVAAANDSDPAVRDVGLRTVADWPDPAAIEPLTALYEQASSEAARALTLRGLTRLLGEQNAQPSPELVGRYRALLSDAKTDNDRKLLLSALAGCPHPDALTLALGELDRPGVQAEARLAASQIAEAIKASHPDAATAALQRLQAK